MSYEKEWFGKVMIMYPGWEEIVCHYIDVRKPITEECWSTQFKWFDNGSLGNTIVPLANVCGKDLMIYGATSMNFQSSDLLFGGFVSKVGQEWTGDLKEKSERYIEAYGYGRYLQENELTKNVPKGNDVEQFNFVADEAIANNILGSKDIYGTITQNSLKQRSGKRTYWDILKEIADDADWDFYVDNGWKLIAFPRGQYTLGVAIVPSFKSRIEYDSSGIINTIEVWGGASDTIGADSIYTESTVNWSGLGLSLDSSEKIIGSFSIKSHTANSNKPYMMRTFSPAIDLERGGKIHFRFKVYNGVPTLGKAGASSIGITMYSGVSSMSKTVGITGGGMYQPYANQYYRFDWGNDSENFVGFNIFDSEGWDTDGTISLSSIDAIRFELDYPVIGNYDNNFWIDDLFFSDISKMAKAGDATSQSNYGIKKGATQRDSNLISTIQCQAIANVMVNTYKNPRVVIEDNDTEDSWGYTLGYRATVSIFDTTVTAEIRELGYTFDGKKLTESVKIAEKYLPKPEKMIKDAVYLLKKLNWNIDLFNKVVSDTAIVDVNSARIDWNRVAEEFPYDAWINVGNYFMPAESQDGYTIVQPSGDPPQFGAGGYVEWIPHTSGGDEAKISSKGNIISWAHPWRMKFEAKTTGTLQGWLVGIGIPFGSGNGNYAYFDFGTGANVYAYAGSTKGSPSLWIDCGIWNVGIYNRLELRYSPYVNTFVGIIGTLSAYLNDTSIGVGTFGLWTPDSFGCMMCIWATSGYDTLNLMNYKIAQKKG